MLREFNPKFRPWRRGRNLQPPSLQCAGSLRKQAQWQTGQGIVVAFGLATLDVHAMALHEAYITLDLAKMRRSVPGDALLGNPTVLLAERLALIRQSRLQSPGSSGAKCVEVPEHLSPLDQCRAASMSHERMTRNIAGARPNRSCLAWVALRW